MHPANAFARLKRAVAARCTWSRRSGGLQSFDLCRALCLLALLPMGLAWSAPAPLPATPLEDPVVPLVPTHHRSEAEQDHLDALARYAAGRIAFQRGDNAAALKQYQRAVRLDPGATTVLQEIVPLAFELNRTGVAVRYALKAIERGPTDPNLLRRLAAFITEEGDHKQALALYERATAAAKKAGEPPSANAVFTDMEMGRLYYLDGKFDRAADCFAAVMKALEQPDQYGLDKTLRKALLGGGEVTYLLFGEAFYDAGRYDDALQAFQQANTMKADAAQLALHQARVYFKQHKLEEAQKQLDEFLATNRDDQGTVPYRLLADLLTARGKADDVLPQLQKLHDTRPDNVPLGYFLAEQYQQAGKTEQAENLYRTLLKDKDASPPIEAYRGLLTIEVARGDAAGILRVLGDSVGRTGAIESLDDAAKQLTSNRELSLQVLDAATKAYDADPKTIPFGERLAAAQLALDSEKFDAADLWYDRAAEVRTDKSPEPVLAWGLQLFLAGRYESAANIFRRVIDLKLLPAENPVAHYYLAGVLEMQGKTDEAVAMAREAAAMKKNSPQFASRAAWILYHARRLDEAKAEYQKLLAQFDDLYDSQETRDVLREARLVLSNIAVLQHDLPAAEEWLEQVLDEFPDDVGASNDLGYLFADQNKHPQRALRMTQLAVAAEPENAAYRDSLGWALYRLGRFDDAVNELRKAASLSTEKDGVLYDHLGDALQKAGDTAAAQDAYQQAAAAFEAAGEKDQAAAVEAKLKK